MSAIGKFIVVEGLEGAGKSTAVHTLQQTLSDLSIPVINTREPGGTAVGETLRSLIKNPDFKDNLQAKTELLLLYAARIQLVHEVIKPALAEGCWVIADRFELSTFAYQGGGRGLDSRFLQQLSSFCLEGFQPDLTFFLELPPELGLQRISVRGELDRIEQESLTFFHKIHQAYKESLQHYPGLRVIDASQPLEAVQALLRQSMTDYVTGQR